MENRIKNANIYLTGNLGKENRENEGGSQIC